MPTPPVNAAVRIRPGKRHSIRQVLQLQDALYDSALSLRAILQGEADNDLRARVASALAQLTRSWDTLENRKRILRGRGLPKPVEPANKPKFKERVELPVVTVEPV